MSFLEKYKSKNAPEKAAPERMPKSKEWFAPITVSRFERLNDLSVACWRLFTILFFENIDSRGKPFALPDYTPDAFGGIESVIHTSGTPPTGSVRSDLDTATPIEAAADHHPMRPPDAQTILINVARMLWRTRGSHNPSRQRDVHCGHHTDKTSSMTDKIRRADAEGAAVAADACLRH